MLHCFTRRRALLTGLLVATVGVAAAPTPYPAPHDSTCSHPFEYSAAVTARFEHSRMAQNGKPAIWMSCGAANADVVFWRGFGVAANPTGEHANNR